MAAEFKDSILYTEIVNGRISNAQVTVDNINMFYHNYDMLLNSVMAIFVPDFNNEHENGFDLTSYLPPWILMYDSTIVSPYYEDSFLFAGAHYQQ